MAINRSKKPDPGTADTSLDAVVQIAEERAGYLEKMRAALLSNDDAQLKLYARKLCGLPPESTPSPLAKRKK
jgi:hypothetical protein